MARSIFTAHSDHDDFHLVKLPDGWKIGREFKPKVNGLIIKVEGGADISVNFQTVHDVVWQFSNVNLDGANGTEIGCWIRALIICNKDIMKVLENESIAKTFEYSLVSIESDEPLAQSLYRIISQPEVAVFNSKMLKMRGEQA